MFRYFKITKMKKGDLIKALSTASDHQAFNQLNPQLPSKNIECGDILLLISNIQHMNYNKSGIYFFVLSGAKKYKFQYSNMKKSDLKKYFEVIA